MKIYNKLFDYQKRIVDSQIKPSSALFMDMGTGKTITSLALFEKSNRKKLLIVCLVSKIIDWRNEINDNFPELSVSILRNGSNKNKEIILNNQFDVYIVSFESVWRLEECLVKSLSNDWYIIVDESHKIKNKSSKVGKYFHKLTNKVTYKCILSGTPQNQGYIDYYNQLYFANILTIKESEFKKMFCVYSPSFFNGVSVNVLSGYKNVELLDQIIHSSCVFFKRDISEEMIPSESYVTIEKHSSFDTFRKKRVYKDILADSSPALRMGLRQLASGFIKEYEVSNHKIEWLKDFLDMYDDNVVIFYNFNTELKMIKDLCEKLNRPYSEYNGSKKNLDNFLNTKNGVAICNYGSASLGLNDLVKANVCIMYSPTEDYILFEQSKKRIDRIGQTKKPLIYYLRTEKSIEFAIYKSLKDGKNFDEKMFDKYMNEN